MYQNKRISIAAAFSDKVVVEPRRRMKEIVCITPPAGTTYELKIGADNDYFTVASAFTFEPTGDDESNNGLYVTNVGPQAGEIQILVVYGGAGGASQLNSVT